MVFIDKLFALVYLVKAFCRKRYLNKLRKKLKNKTPSIISVNCIGGIIYHNLGLKFFSPTINLYFDKEDFFIFLENIKEFVDAELIECFDLDVSYPVGCLYFNNKNVLIHFMHYNTFDYAKKKWNERKQRIDFDNLYIIHMIPDSTGNDFERFNSLPYKNKLLISDKNPRNYENIYVHKVFTQKNYFAGKILKTKNKFSFKTYLDDIDYVSFLNKN